MALSHWSPEEAKSSGTILPMTLAVAVWHPPPPSSILLNLTIYISTAHVESRLNLKQPYHKIHTLSRTESPRFGTEFESPPSCSLSQPWATWIVLELSSKTLSASSSRSVTRILSAWTLISCVRLSSNGVVYGVFLIVYYALLIVIKNVFIWQLVLKRENHYCCFDSDLYWLQL